MKRTWVALPHIPEHLDVGRDLLLGAEDAVLVEVVDEILVAPARATTAEIRPGGAPVLAKAVEEDVLSVLGPDLRGAVLEHLAMTALGEGDMLVVGGRYGRVVGMHVERDSS